MSSRTRDAKQQSKARQRRRLQAQERLARDRRQAQHAAAALQQALNDLGLPEDLMVEIEGRLQSQQKLLAFPILNFSKHSRAFLAHTP